MESPAPGPQIVNAPRTLRQADPAETVQGHDEDEERKPEKKPADAAEEAEEDEPPEKRPPPAAVHEEVEKAYGRDEGEADENPRQRIIREGEERLDDPAGLFLEKHHGFTPLLHGSIRLL